MTTVKYGLFIYAHRALPAQERWNVSKKNIELCGKWGTNEGIIFDTSGSSV